MYRSSNFTLLKLLTKKRACFKYISLSQRTNKWISLAALSLDHCVGTHHPSKSLDYNDTSDKYITPKYVAN